MSTPELDWITVKGFKSIASIEKLPLRSINVIIGPNGSGKSNFVEVFAFLHAIREGRLANYVTKNGGADKLLYFGSKTTEKIQLHLSFAGETNQYSLDLVPGGADDLAPADEQVYFWNKARFPDGPMNSWLSRAGKEAGISNPNAEGRVEKWVRLRLARWRLYHFHDTSSSSPMKKTADVEDNRYLREDGSNLAAFLHFLKERHGDSYSMIRRTVQRVTPFFDDFQLEPSRLNPDKILLEWRHKNSDKYFDASSLSDGSLRFIALATLFLQPEEFRPSVILLDEPELGLHPHAITMLATLVKSVVEHTQVILSTQSSLLLDHFNPEDVLVAERVDGGTLLTHLDPKRLESWLEQYSLGQLWEKNEIGGRP